MKKKLVCIAMIVTIGIAMNFDNVNVRATEVSYESNQLNDEDNLYYENEIKKIEQQKEYINKIIQETGGTVTDDTAWRYKLNYLKENYDLIKNIKDINMEQIDNYIEVYTAQLYFEEFEAQSKTANIMRAPSVATTSYTSSYVRSKAVAYARQYAINPNPNYPNWNSYGGDCANFVSQCLHEGGISMVGTEGAANATSSNNWFSYGTTRDTSKVSSTWRGANMFKWYWQSRAKKYYVLSDYKQAFSKATFGDVIQLLDTDGVARHTLIIVARDTSNQDLILAAHTSNTSSARLSAKCNIFGGGFILYSMK